MHLSRNATPEEVAPLLQMLCSAGPVSPKLAAFVVAKAAPLLLKKGKLLLKEGELCTHIFFIRTGVLRGFIRNGTTDTTTWITTENEMAASISSFVRQVEAPDYIQAIEDCELLAISHADMETAYELYPPLETLSRVRRRLSQPA